MDIPAGISPWWLIYHHEDPPEHLLGRKGSNLPPEIVQFQIWGRKSS